jgi:hypothetical protein
LLSLQAPAPITGGNLPVVLVEEMARKALKDWTIEIDRDPFDAHVFDPAASDEGDELRMAAWRISTAPCIWKRPPANPAIALTLAMMRGQSMHFDAIGHRPRLATSGWTSAPTGTSP